MKVTGIALLVLGLVGGATLTLAAVGGFLVLRDNDTPRQDAAPEPDRVVGVALRCSYQVQERGADGRLTTVTRDGGGEYCWPPNRHTVGSITVLWARSHRAIVTVRTPQGSVYTVETTGVVVKVGDPWPPPGQ